MKNKTASTAVTPAAPAVMRKSVRPSCVAVLPSISRPAAEYPCISAMLLLGHIIETAVQIYLCQHYWHLTTRWAAGLAALLAATVAIVNGASIVGVRRGLDFADRWFGQCLCYVMHLSLLGLVWRFLKLTFLYDRTDLREFALLRFVQVHLQTLPSLLLQTCLIYQHGLLNTEVTGVPIGLAITQLIVSGVTIALTTLVLSMPTTGVPSPSSSSSTASRKQATVDAMETGIASVVGIYQIQRRDQSTSRTSGGYSTHQCVITAVRSICLLWCRTVAVGVFMTEFHVWTLIVFGVHWCIALLWLVLQDSASELQAGQAAIPSPAVSLFRRALVAYLLVFDWPPRYQQKHSGWKLNGHEDKSSPVQSILPAAAGSWLDVVGLGGEPRSVAVALYYGISGVENAAMLSLWFHFAPPSDLVPPVARLTTLATCTAALTLGVLCVVASTQGPDDESSQSQQNQLESVVSTDSGRFQSSARPITAVQSNNDTVISTGSSSSSGISKPMSSSTPSISRSNNNNNSSNKMGLLAPSCTVVQQREVRTVVTAQVHRTRLTQSALNMAANHSHPAPMEPPPPPPPPAIDGLMPDHHHSLSWPIETAVSVCDDQSSNSRNTNTLDGQTLNGGCGGSGSGVSCSSPLFHAPPPAPVASVTTPNVNMSTHPSCHRNTITARRSPYGQEQQQPQIATTSNGSGSGAVVKRPYLIRRNSSCSSLMKPTIVVSNTTKTWAGGAVGKGRHQQQRRRQRKQRKQQRHQHHDSCHCRIFDDYGMPGIVIRENRSHQRHHQRPCPAGSSRSGTLKSVETPITAAMAAVAPVASTSASTGSIGRLSHGLHFESDAHHQKQQPQFQIVCTKCMTGHDPLLTDCCARSKTLPVRRQRAATTSAGCRKQQQQQCHTTARRVPLRMSAVNSECMSSSSSETETETSSGNSSSSYSSTSGHSSRNVDDSDATYTTWPPKARANKVPSMEHLLSAATAVNTKTTPSVGPSPWNYVHAWLVNANQQQQQQQRRSPSGSRTATLAVTSGSRQVKRLQQQQPSSQHHYANHYVSSSTSRRPKQQPLDVIVQDIYSAYSTVPPRLGQTVKELSLVRRSAGPRRSATASASAAVELPVYSTPVEISV